VRNVIVSTIQPLGEKFAFDSSDSSKYAAGEILDRVNGHIDYICSLLDRVGEAGTDIVCMPEEAPGIGGCRFYEDNPSGFAEIVRASSKAFLPKVCERASRYKMYVVAACYTLKGGEIYNAAFLIDRQGDIVGCYHKTHLPAAERKLLAAGSEYPVFETDFGKVAIAICYDMMFPEVARIYSISGARILFVPTQGFQFGGEINGEMRMRVRAFDNSLYIVTSQCASEKRNRPGRSCIIDCDGHLLADAGYDGDTFVSADVDMDREHYEFTDAQESGIPDWRKRFLSERRPQTYQMLVDPNGTG